MESPSEGIEIFIAYAEEDEKLEDELEKHLALLKRQGFVTCWHYRKIPGGGEWDGDIDEHLKTFGIFLPLISADFIVDPKNWTTEMGYHR